MFCERNKQIGKFEVTAVKVFFSCGKPPCLWRMRTEIEKRRQLSFLFYALNQAFRICIMIPRTPQLKLDRKVQNSLSKSLSAGRSSKRELYFARYIMGLNCPRAHLLRDEQFVNTAIMGRVL